VYQTGIKPRRPPVVRGRIGPAHLCLGHFAAPEGGSGGFFDLQLAPRLDLGEEGSARE
jgi:hypothetical protein